MRTLKPRAVPHLIVTAAIIAAMFGLAPARALAQRDNRPPAQPGPPPAAAEPRPAPAPPPAPNDGAGWLGISMAELTPEKAREVKLNDLHGAVVTGVTENSSAAKAGLAGGDIIIEFRGQRVEGTLELARLVRETPPGRVAKITVWRDGRSRDFSVEMARAPGLFSGNLLSPEFQERLRQFEDRMQRRFGRNAPPPSGAGPGAPAPPNAPAPLGPPPQRGAAGAPVLGIAVQDVSGQFGQYLKVPDGQGVLVTEVQTGSAAEKGGLHVGDVIISVDGQRVRNAAELRGQVRRTNESRTATLRVIRNGAETTVHVEISATPAGARAGDRPAIPI